MTREEQITHMKKLVLKLNQYRDEYYNQNAPSIPDSTYDRLFDELEVLEKRTGIILSGSPTQTVGYHPVSELPKVKHPIPLLSLDKTKLTRDILDFVQKGKGLTNLTLKMDGLTVKLVYDGGELQQASTRGDGEIGEDITHNIPAFINVPLTVPYKDRLVITGEAHIRIDDFEKLRTSILDRNGEPYKTPRNLASGSVRTLNPAVCKERCVSFIPFNVLEGLDYEAVISNSRASKLLKLKDYGFGYCDSYTIDKSATEEQIETYIECLQTIAREKMIPIDGIVAVYDNISYSKAVAERVALIKTAWPSNLRMIRLKQSSVQSSGRLPGLDSLPQSHCLTPLKLMAARYPGQVSITLPLLKIWSCSQAVGY